MIVDTAGPIDAPRDAVVVVGSGAAGLALTEALVAAGRTVVLLESGTDVADGPTGTAAADDLNAGSSTGLRYAGLEHGRTRVLGGAAQLWHGQCTRLHPWDLEHRPWLANSGWPIGVADLAAFYPAAEGWLGVSGDGYGAERWAEHPRLDPLAWDQRYLLHDFTEYTPHPLLGAAHRPALARSAGALVHTGATVTRVCTDGARVTGVEIARPDATRFRLDATQVVLAGGAIENARILQLSDPAGVGLGAGRVGVGRYLQDHPIIDTAEFDPVDHHVLQDRYVALHRGHRRLFPKVRLAPSAQRRYGLVDANAVFVHDHDQPGLAAARRLLQAARSRRRPEQPGRDVLTAVFASPGPVARDAVRRYVRGLSTGARPSRVRLQVWLEQQPDPDSRVTLGDDVDALGLRRAVVHWRSNPVELETSRRITDWIAADLDRLGVARTRLRPAMHDDDAWRAGVADAFHPSGTTRMSAHARDGVVDTDLQVHGVHGLFAVGGSVFPIAGYANPTLTIVALALRLAQRLRTSR